MKNKFFLLSIAIAIFSVAISYAQIVEKKHIASVSEYVKEYQKGLCVIFDLDNTVMHPVKDESSDEWFYGYVQYYIDQGMSRGDAIKKVLPDLFRETEKATVRPVEPEVVTLIKDLQKKKIPVIALTSRSPELARCTIKQLCSIGIDFSRTGFSAWWPLSFKELSYPARYVKGIMFCSSNPKGKTLLELFKKMKFHAKKVIFIDDKRKYHEELQQTLSTIGVNDFIGIRYSFLDEKVKNFKFDPSKYITPLPSNTKKNSIVTIPAAA